MTQLNDCVQRMAPQSRDGKRVGVLEVTVDDRVIHGVSVWRMPDGKLSVFFPSYTLPDGRESVGVPAERRPLLEEAIIAAYEGRVIRHP